MFRFATYFSRVSHYRTSRFVSVNFLPILRAFCSSQKMKAGSDKYAEIPIEDIKTEDDEKYK